MTEFNRRTFVGMSVGGLSAACLPSSVLAATQCVSGQLPGFQPNMVTVDCASRRNFRTFRQNPEYLGLAGVVSMSSVRGSQGSYQAGNLFLFPWVKPKGKSKNFSALMPMNASQSVSVNPIPDDTLPLGDYFCRIVLQAPWTSFIGFQVDQPYEAWEAKQGWFSNVEKLADGEGVGIDWTSANLNPPWFGGSHWIPSSDKDCSGEAWRKLIVSGLHQASSQVC